MHTGAAVNIGREFFGQYRNPQDTPPDFYATGIEIDDFAHILQVVPEVQPFGRFLSPAGEYRIDGIYFKNTV